VVRDDKIRAFGSSTFPADLIVKAQWAAERRGLLWFRGEPPHQQDDPAARIRSITGSDPVPGPAGKRILEAARAFGHGGRRCRVNGMPGDGLRRP